MSNETTGHEDTQGRKQKDSDLADRQREQALDALEALAAGRVTEDRIKQEGNELVLPTGMTTRDARKFLRDYEEQQERSVAFTRVLPFRPWDGAHALQEALYKAFGTRGVGVNTMMSRAQKRTINTGTDSTAQVPWGTLAIPQFEDAEFSLHAVEDEEKGLLFGVAVDVKQKYQVAVEGFFQLLEQELRENSIYRGKAFDGRQDPEFIDTTSVDESKVIYNRETLAQMEANIWAHIVHTDVFREKGESLKRAVLLEGPYGTGKTLAAYLTAKKAQAHGWTFIYCRPADNMKDVMATARLYQPCVVLIEDVDTVAEGTADRDKMSEVLDIFDGLPSKGTDITVVLTTNHKDRLHKGMLRPGRLDAIIHVGELEAESVVDLIQATTPHDMLSEDIDYMTVGEAMEGFLPAFVREAVSRATRYSIARNKGEAMELTTEDFVTAAGSLRPQLVLMEEADDAPNADPLSETLKGLVEDVVVSVNERTYMDTDDGEHIVSAKK